MATIKTKIEIEKIRKSAKVLAEILEFVLPKIKIGMSTFEIDEIIEKKILEKKAIPCCKGFFGYPACSCLSVNDQVTHGIPSKNIILKDGDIIDVDVAIEFNGGFSDMSRMVSIGNISKEAKKLIDIAKESFFQGFENVKPGNTLNQVGLAIQKHVESNNFSVVRDYVGHFIGNNMHESPEVLNYYVKGNDFVLKEGMVLCIEPMINAGKYKVITDGWSVKTADKSLSARYEDTILVTKNGAEILTKMKNE